jgi:AcrR family transcriptional regulator
MPKRETTLKSRRKRASKKPETSYHHGDLKNALIQAGLAILAREGTSHLSLRETARLAGVSQAAPYRHFANKEALLAAIAQEGFLSLTRMLRDLAPEQHPPQCHLTEAATVHLKLARNRPDHFRLMFGGLAPMDLKEHPELGCAAREAFSEFVGIVRNCQISHAMRRENPRLLAALIWCTSHGLANLAMDNRLAALGIGGLDDPPEHWDDPVSAARAETGPPADPEILIRRMTDQMMQGLRHPPRTG